MEISKMIVQNMLNVSKYDNLCENLTLLNICVKYA
jgi:hypothetical protein